MAHPDASPLRRTALYARHVALKARMVPFGGWDMPVEYSGITDEHLAVRTRAGAVRRQPHGRDRDRGQGRARRRPAHHVQRRREAAGRAGPVLRPDDAERARSSTTCSSTGCARPLPAGRQRRRTSRRTSRWIARADRRRSATRWPSTQQLAYALLAVAGAGSARGAAAADGRRSGGDQVLLVRARRSRRRPRRRSRAPATRARTASRSSSPPASGRAASGTRSCRPGSAADLMPVRPRRARHAAPRGGHAPVRQRHRRHDDGARGGPRVDRRLEEGRLHRPRRRSSAEGRRASRASSSGFEMIDRGIARHGYPVVVDGTAGRRRHERHADAVPQEGDRHGLRARRHCARRHRARDRHPRPPRAGARRPAAVLQAVRGSRRRCIPTDAEVHEGSRVDPASRADSGRVGITDYAQKQLGDVVLRRAAGRRHDGRRRGSRSARSSRSRPSRSCSRRCRAKSSRSTAR